MALYNWYLVLVDTENPVSVLEWKYVWLHLYVNCFSLHINLSLTWYIMEIYGDHNALLLLIKICLHLCSWFNFLILILSFEVFQSCLSAVFSHVMIKLFYSTIYSYILLQNVFLNRSRLTWYFMQFLGYFLFLKLHFSFHCECLL